MKILKKIILILFAFTATISCSQSKNTNSAIEEVFYQYIESTKSNDADLQFKFLYPEQFDEIPKNLIKELHKAIKEEPPYEMKDEKIYKISQIFEKEDIKYAKIFFNLNLIVDLKKKNNNPNFDQESYISELKETFGKSNVLYDKQNAKIIIKNADFIYVIFHPKYNVWQILLTATVGDGSVHATEQLIPKDILNKLNEN